MPNRIICSFFGILACVACSGNPQATSNPVKTPLVVFAAGSLIIPFTALEKAFEAEYPDIDVLSEYHGSIQVMRHVTDLHESIDVVATADASLIPMLMYATTHPDSGQPNANWYIRFATNRLALAYRPESRYAGEINVENWMDVLARPNVLTGIADPRFDASGYRALMAFALAEMSTRRYDLFDAMFRNQFTYPITIFRDDPLTTITVPEILEMESNAHVVLRGASIELIALLEAGEMDYAFEYESVILQHGLEMLRLPDEVNLGEASLDSLYHSVQVDLDFQRFATVKPQFLGEQIGYGITIASGALHPEEAALFISFLLGPQGRLIMEEQHHAMLTPPGVDGAEHIPASIFGVISPAGGE